MKKNGKGLIIIVVILVLMVIGLCSYICYDKFISNDKKEEVKNDIEEPSKEEITEETKDENSNLPEKAKDHTFLKMYTQNIILNNKENNLVYYYYYDKGTANADDRNKEYYITKKEVYLNKTKIVDMHIIGFFETEQDATNYVIGDYQESYSEDVATLKDNQAKVDYLVYSYQFIEKDSYISTGDPEESKTIIVDENGKVIDTIVTGLPYVDISPISNERDKAYSFGSTIYVSKFGYIYYLDLQNKHCNYSAISLDEYKLEIINGKLQKTKTKSYDDASLNIAGASLCG